MKNQITVILRHRHLIWDLALKDIKVRYRSPTLGFLWAIIIPLVMVFIFKLIFSDILKMTIEECPFFIYLMTALFPWVYFSSSLNAATESILGNRDLIKKTYFPRQTIPIATVLANLINSLPSFVVMLLILAFFKTPPTFMVLWLLPIIILQTVFTIGLAFIVSSLTVITRDVKYLVEILITVWFYLVPSFYPLATVAAASGSLFKLYLLNPFVGFVILYRVTLLKGYADTLPPEVHLGGLIVWVAFVSVAAYFLGALVFQKYERRLSDFI
jgi:ABC-2 type transport system permease protein